MNQSIKLADRAVVARQRYASRDLLILGAMILISRVLLLGIVGAFSGWREFADDIDMLQEISRHPIQLLIGHSRYGQHPPMLGLVQALVFQPIDTISVEFFNYRFALVCYEVLSAVLLWFALSNDPSLAANKRVLLVAAFVVMPSQWMTSVVMAQDEIIAACFIIAMLLAVGAGRNALALFIASLAVVAGKVFAILPLIALVLFLPTPIWEDVWSSGSCRWSSPTVCSSSGPPARPQT